MHINALDGLFPDAFRFSGLLTVEDGAISDNVPTERYKKSASDETLEFKKWRREWELNPPEPVLQTVALAARPSRHRYIVSLNIPRFSKKANPFHKKYRNHAHGESVDTSVRTPLLVFFRCEKSASGNFPVRACRKPDGTLPKRNV